MNVTFHTVVLDVAPTPMGLVGRSFVVRHRCVLCSATVASGDLVNHARSHDGPPSPREGGATD